MFQSRMEALFQASCSITNENTMIQGPEEMCCDSEEVVDQFEDNGYENDYDEETQEDDQNEETDDINEANEEGNIDLAFLLEDEVRHFHFGSLEMAYKFYNQYAKMRGFAARKSKTVKNSKGAIIQQTFVCFKEGHRDEKFLKMENRKREPRAQTRCGCEAKLLVKVDSKSGLWHVRYFSDNHNHELLSDKYIGMLAAHRKMNESDVLQMNNMRQVGISLTHIFASFARQSGGFQNIGFNMQDMYNQMEKERGSINCDAKGALLYLRELRSSDPAMFWRHTVDSHGRLERLFWCDGTSQVDYEVFGDVVAFDATYKRNKYRYPLVVFSGVNHHNQTIVFASALVANECEETYVWLLEQFTEAMKGKCPTSVITDGDTAMKNAIRTVFPEAHHRLCAWHLLRNATSNVGMPGFTQELKNCMLGDYEVGEFRRKWEAMVKKYGVEDHGWVNEMYEKRKMWATAHIRGNFFAGFRTTSRCEGLHSQIKRFVHSRNNLVEFLQHFNRCLNQNRFKEMEADFKSLNGEPVLQTPLKSLERSAAKVYTREIFLLFRPVLVRACRMNVIGHRETTACDIYLVTKSCGGATEWHVTLFPSNLHMTCSCMRMESLGIPCEHLVAVMVYVDIDQLPTTLVLPRWTKSAKEGIERRNGSDDPSLESIIISRYAALLEICRQLCTLASRNSEDFNDLMEKVMNELELLQLKNQVHDQNVDNEPIMVRDPARVRTKGRGSQARRKGKRLTHCSVCKGEGHNRKTCPLEIATHVDDAPVESNYEDPHM